MLNQLDSAFFASSFYQFMLNCCLVVIPFTVPCTSDIHVQPNDILCFPKWYVPNCLYTYFVLNCRFPLTVAPCKRRLKGEGEGLKEVHVEEGRQKQCICVVFVFVILSLPLYLCCMMYPCLPTKKCIHVVIMWLPFWLLFQVVYSGYYFLLIYYEVKSKELDRDNRVPLLETDKWDQSSERKKN